VAPNDLELRLKTAQTEIKSASEYDFQVVNKTGHLDETIEKVANIIAKYL
jgi:guanylate kinase